MSPLIKLISLPLLMLALFSCKPYATGGDAALPQLALHTYKIPTGMGEQVVYLLNNSMKNDGSAQLLPNGHLALVASPAIHGGMDELLVTLKDAPALQTVNGQMEFWFVLSRNNGQQESNLDDPELISALAQITPTRNWHLLEKMTIHAAEGSLASARGNYINLEYSLKKQQGSLMASLDLEGVGFRTSLSTQLYIQPDKYVILGETSMELDEMESKKLGVTEGQYSLMVVIKTRTNME